MEDKKLTLQQKPEDKISRSILSQERPERLERLDRLERPDTDSQNSQISQIRVLELENAKLKIKINQLKAKAQGYEDLCDSLVTSSTASSSSLRSNTLLGQSSIKTRK